MATSCFKCRKDLGLKEGARVARAEECPHCRADVHVCLNCKHYDTRAYNQCRESQAERVVEKERANFCDYFGLGSAAAASGTSTKSDTLKKLDDLFK